MIELPILDGAGSAHEERPAQKFWRSAAHLKQDAQVEALARNEFMPGAADAPGGASRRQFLQLMGASMAMAGLTACRRPVETILPYTRKPEEVIPGIASYYATAMPFRGIVRGLLVESNEGRPTKIEGNPEHPTTQGTTSLFEQASILNLYDPNRSVSVLREGSKASWRDVVRFAQELLPTQRVAVLSGPTSSPTLLAQRRRLEQRFPGLRWVTYEAEGDNGQQLGTQLAFGRPLRPRYQFDQAQVIVSLDGDFLDPTERNFVHNTRTFSDGRRLEKADDTMSRLYAVESNYSLTGGMADHRKRLRAGDIPAFAAALAARLGVGGMATAGARFANDRFLTAMADDLRRAGSAGVVVAGESQPAEVHALVAALNSALGSTVVTYFDTGADPLPPQTQALAGLVDDMRTGQVDTVVMLDVNPVYSLPPELGFAEALRQVQNSIHLGLYIDETARASRWHVPQAHYLEAWGDGRAYDGTLSVIQPLIAPLYDDAKSDVELLALLATGTDQPGYDLVREAWRGTLSGTFEKTWRKALHDGFVADTAYSTVSPSAGPVALTALPATADGELEVVFGLDMKVLDGRFANNVWMQELPHPTTKIVWDTVALVSPATAEELGFAIKYDAGSYYVDVIEISANGQSVALPVWAQPGLPDGSIALSLGYGRELTATYPLREKAFFSTDAYTDVFGKGPVANGVGKNVAVLRGATMARVLRGAEVRATGETHKIATTQEHGTMEGRPVVRMGTLDEYRANPDFPTDEVPMLTGSPEPTWGEYPPLWDENHPTDEPAIQDSLYHVNQWGMVIDLNACTGCNACIVACHSENNVQMVGKEEVSVGREMQWLRVDRYFASNIDDEGNDMSDPMMVMAPIPCMHCENAPCESVCPVAATSHSPDGINEMTYNRCIGTRYCSNNCPYKVRRYNFFNWAKTMPETVEMAMNPNVTVRFRGVMEKCTYCVQRVREGQRTAKVEERGLRDGEVQTACQQVCPAGAITFGDINDPTSQVSQWKRNPRRYDMLAELNVKPRTSYLGRVRNPNPALEGAEA